MKGRNWDIKIDEREGAWVHGIRGHVPGKWVNLCALEGQCTGLCTLDVYPYKSPIYRVGLGFLVRSPVRGYMGTWYMAIFKFFAGI